MVLPRQSSQDSSKGFSLKDAFKRLGIRARSASPATKGHGKPLPVLPPRSPSQQRLEAHQPTAVSLPPYLAHLAASSSTSASPNLPFPQPRINGSAASHAEDELYIDSSRFPPRPPVLALTYSTPQPPSAPPPHPTSLIPAALQLQTDSKQPYPWELVPQLKSKPVIDSERSDSTARPDPLDKENVAPVGISSLDNASHKVAASPINLVTPPRTQKATRHTSASASHTLGTRTPNGSQKDPSCPPAKGQCWGIKQDGTRCTRKVRAPTKVTKLGVRTPSRATRERERFERGASAPPVLRKGASAAEPLVVGDSGSEDELSTTYRRALRMQSPASKDAADDSEEVYCFQHVAEVNKTNGFYSVSAPSSKPTGGASTAGDFVQFSDWFDTVELSDHAQALLRKCMSRPLTDVDRAELGYLYIHELRDRSNSTHLCLKVGRSAHIFRRLNEWRTRCYSKDYVPRAYYPSKDQHALLSGVDTVQEPGVPLSHRWETLVHLELASVGLRVHEICPDCGTRHREIFMIPRSLCLHSSEEQHDGFDVVRRIVVKWMRFVQTIA